MNPVSAMSYKVWDNQKQEYIKWEGKWDWEFLHKEDAQREIDSRGV